MKRHIQAGALILVLACLSIGQVSAQTTLSFRGGASIATLGGPDIDDIGSTIDSRTGLNVGAALTFGLGGNLGVQVGGAYVQKGFSLTEQSAKVTFALNYIEIPVLLRVGIPTAGNISPHFFLGLAISIEAGCSVEASDQGVSVSVDCSEGDFDVKSTDLGGMGGVGLDIATAGPLSITLDVIYNLGLSSIDDAASSDDLKNRAWSILAGVSLPIG